MELIYCYILYDIVKISLNNTFNEILNKTILYPNNINNYTKY